jgi:SecD/SecF fusion protein
LERTRYHPTDAREANFTLQSRSYLFLLFVVALSALSGFLFTLRPYNYGLDVSGGVRFTFEMDTSKLPKGEELSSVQNRIEGILLNRATGGLGVVEPTIQKKGTTGFIVELPGVTDAEEARKLMSTTARIEWYHATNVSTVKLPNRMYNETDADGDKPEVWFMKRGSDEVIKPTIPDPENPERTIRNPEYQRIIEGWTLILSGDELADAQPIPMGDKYIPSMRFSSEGARKMERWSRANTYRGEKLAAVLDGVVMNVAPLKEGAIISSEGIIDGNFSVEYVKSLTSLLKSGSLPVSLVETSSTVVDPTVGQFALERIVFTGLISFGIIAAFLIVYYVFPGIVALIALALYVLITLTVLKWIGATFSLAAIAGFILSVGMAVDANILVFERVKEEMRADRPLMRAIELGFSRALPAIIDSNACTILTSMVLANLGTGPVKGFATTLIIGVALSLFTAITVTRSLLVFLVGSGLGANPKWYGLNRQWFGEGLEQSADTKQLKIVERSKLFFTISIVTIIPGIIAMVMLGGFKTNVEFSGGYEGTYLSGNISADQVRSSLERAGLKGANVKFMSTDEAKQKLAELAGITNLEKSTFQSVGPSVRDETIRNAVLGIVFSTGLIIVWLAVRFGFALGGFVVGLRFAMSVIVALIHDVMIVLGLAAIMGAVAGWEISALFISAMLTVIGFSTHDTIVIFDRIRENLRKPLPNEDMAMLVNRSITQSIARSINTSGTVVITLILLIFVGSATPELKLFNAAMLAGILSGTYSSIFNAAPILYLWDRAIGRKQGEHNTMIAISRNLANQVRITQPVTAPSAGPTPDAPGTGTTPSGGAYGQTKRRRASDAQKGIQNLDD